MSSREFTEWMEYYKIDPFGAERTDLNSALVATTIANANRSEDQDPFELEDFMMELGERLFREDPLEATFEDFEPVGPAKAVSTFELLNTLYGGVDLRKN